MALKLEYWCIFVGFTVKGGTFVADALFPVPDPVSGFQSDLFTS